MHIVSITIFLTISSVAFSQIEKFVNVPKKGSYLYYGQPAFEDNSFLLEEAITQEKGVIQHITNFHYDNLRGGNIIFSFSQEIPITHLRHQLNYTIYYSDLNPTASSMGGGLGDISIGYHYMAMGKTDWAMVVPGLTIIIPTGKAETGSGYGGLGAQLSLAVTKRLSHSIITNYTIGFTFISKADRYKLGPSGNNILSYEKDLQHGIVGASIIWYPTRKFNWLLEYVSNFNAQINTDGSVARYHFLTLNPGFRFAIDHKRVQIVPGLSLPIVFKEGNFEYVGLFLYLSFEPEYLPFSKSKSR